MLKYILLIVLIAGCFMSYSQSTVGLIAHWDMNGTVNDVSGNGHNGTPTSITSSAGQCGLPGTAYIFNGTTSVITVANKSDLNLTSYSICAVVKVADFYTGICQGNYIMTRGDASSAGNYNLGFDDNAYDSNCYHSDTSYYVFNSAAGADHNVNSTSSQYIPTIVRNTWYRLVATYDGSNIRMYVNGVLKSTASTIHVSIGTSTNAISIGYNVAGGSTFPYPFTGQIDDICLYNRVLTATEIADYGAPVSITTQPVDTSILQNHNATFTVASSISSPTYQWQKDAGTGFTNLTNTAPYSGVTTNTLTISNAPLSISGYHYRCIVSNGAGCPDTSVSVALNVTVSVSSIVSSDMIQISPNPTHDKFVISLPGSLASCRLQLANAIGQVIREELVTGSKATIDISQLPVGMYIVKCYYGDVVINKKLLKE